MAIRSDLSVSYLALLAVVGFLASVLAAGVFGLAVGAIVSAFECGWRIVR